MDRPTDALDSATFAYLVSTMAHDARPDTRVQPNGRKPIEWERVSARAMQTFERVSAPNRRKDD